MLGKIGVRAPLAISDWRLHAFALMDNDDHLFVLAPQANLSAGMPFLGRVVHQLFQVGQAIGRVEAARSRIGRIVQEWARRLTNG